jgi:hypothetical protein
MNSYFALAGGLALLVGLAHSVLGELLIFRRLTKDSLPSLAPFSLIEVRKMGLAGSTDFTRRTLRFTWHLPTVLGWGFGAILLRLSLPSSLSTHLAFVESATALSVFASSLIVLFVSRGKHPGWVIFLANIIIVETEGQRVEAENLIKHSRPFDCLRVRIVLREDYDGDRFINLSN